VVGIFREISCRMKLEGAFGSNIDPALHIQRIHGSIYYSQSTSSALVIKCSMSGKNFNFLYVKEGMGWEKGWTS